MGKKRPDAVSKTNKSFRRLVSRLSYSDTKKAKATAKNLVVARSERDRVPDHNAHSIQAIVGRPSDSHDIADAADSSADGDHGSDDDDKEEDDDSDSIMQNSSQSSDGPSIPSPTPMLPRQNKPRKLQIGINKSSRSRLQPQTSTRTRTRGRHPRRYEDYPPNTPVRVMLAGNPDLLDRDNLISLATKQSIVELVTAINAAHAKEYPNGAVTLAALQKRLTRALDRIAQREGRPKWQVQAEFQERRRKNGLTVGGRGTKVEDAGAVTTHTRGIKPTAKKSSARVRRSIAKAPTTPSRPMRQLRSQASSPTEPRAKVRVIMKRPVRKPTTNRVSIAALLNPCSEDISCESSITSKASLPKTSVFKESAGQKTTLSADKKLWYPSASPFYNPLRENPDWPLPRSAEKTDNSSKKTVTNYHIFSPDSNPRVLHFRHWHQPEQPSDATPWQPIQPRMEREKWLPLELLADVSLAQASSFPQHLPLFPAIK